MFNCQQCGKTSKPGDSQYRVVVKTRRKEYPMRYEAMPDGNDDPGGVGTEIVTEKTVCEQCFSEK